LEKKGENISGPRSANRFPPYEKNESNASGIEFKLKIALPSFALIITDYTMELK
jgi:hypothetical protein